MAGQQFEKHNAHAENIRLGAQDALAQALSVDEGTGQVFGPVGHQLRHTTQTAQLRVQRRVEQNVPAFDVPVDQLPAVERKEPPAHSPSCQGKRPSHECRRRGAGQAVARR